MCPRRSPVRRPRRRRRSPKNFRPPRRSPRRTATDAYARAAAANIQIHGGIGFTWEHPAHMYFKRAKSLGHAAGRRHLPPPLARGPVGES